MKELDTNFLNKNIPMPEFKMNDIYVRLIRDHNILLEEITEERMEDIVGEICTDCIIESMNEAIENAILENIITMKTIKEEKICQDI